MRPALRAHADRQGGIVTRRQAKAAGYTERELRTLTAVNGPWLVVRRGAYVERTTWRALDKYDGQARARDLAAHLTMATPHLMSHDSAARALGLPMLRPEHELVHITRYGVGGTRTEHGVKHHMTQLGLLNTQLRDGMRVTGNARTAVDLAREHGFLCGTVACDAALERGLEIADLEAELVPMWCWPGVTQARAAVGVPAARVCLRHTGSVVALRVRGPLTPSLAGGCASRRLPCRCRWLGLGAPRDPLTRAFGRPRSPPPPGR